jgi:uncharacterized protein (DUF427 family)
MKAILNGTVLANSDDIVAAAGYDYFPPSAVRVEFLQKAARTPKDLECPHGVQFYDVVLADRRYPRNAWVYESPQPRLASVGGRFGFWQDVKVG